MSAIADQLGASLTFFPEGVCMDCEHKPTIDTISVSDCAPFAHELMRIILYLNILFSTYQNTFHSETHATFVGSLNLAVIQNTRNRKTEEADLRLRTEYVCHPKGVVYAKHDFVIQSQN